MAVGSLTFLAPNAGAVFNTRSGTFTADANGFISGVPILGTGIPDLIASGCVPCIASPYANFRNLLDGGDFTVNPWQRNIPGLASGGVLSSPITSTTPGYFPDRWFAVGAGTCSIYMSNIADTTVPGFNASCFVGRTSGQTQTVALSFGQVMEPADVTKCQGQTVTFSFYARAGALYSGGAMTAQMVSGTGNAANNTAANLATAGFTGSAVVATAAITLTGGMTRYSISGVVPVGATELGVLFTWSPTGTAGATDGIFFNGCQLEIGGLSPFEHRDIQVETEIAQRYAWVVAEPAANVVVGSGIVGAGGNAEVFYLAAPVQMAKAPTVTVSAGSFKSNSATAGVVAATGLTGNATHTVNAIGLAATGTGTAGQGALLQGGGGSGYIIASADY